MDYQHRYEGFLKCLNESWTPYLAYLTLLGVCLILLGISLAGLVAALMNRNREREAFRRLTAKRGCPTKQPPAPLVALLPNCRLKRYSDE
jgi:hypothetical protein